MNTHPQMNPAPHPIPAPQQVPPPMGAPMMPPVAPGKPRPLFQLKKGDNTFALVGMLLSIFASIFGICGGFALGYLLALVGMVVLFTLYLSQNKKINSYSLICGALCLASGVIFICTSNSSVRLWGLLIGGLLFLTACDGLANGKPKGNQQTLGVFYSAASTLANIGVAIRSLFKTMKGFSKALLGLLCAIPVILIVIPLLISSDYAFRGMMTMIFDNTLATLLKTVLGIGISLFVITYGFSLKTGKTAKAKILPWKGIENIYIISFLSAIGVCYVLYLVSQLAYFFSAFQGFLPAEWTGTYSQYARKGFFEMCIIAVINLAIVFLAFLFAKKREGKVCHTIKGIATFIAAFTLLIIATAISKMVLYIGAYGMTVLRITTSAFMLFLAIVFVSVICRIYNTKINIVKTALLAAGCIVVLLGVVNVNAVCAKYNYESYQSGTLDSIDIEALYNLGEEGIPYIVELAKGKDPIATEAQNYLATAYLYDYFEDMEDVDTFTVDDLKKNRKNKGFEYFSIPRAKAYNSLYEFAETNDWFPPVCQGYAQRSYSYDSAFDIFDFFFLPGF